eukprot:77586-Chlamydomonas_euryale.AAC.3
MPRNARSDNGLAIVHAGGAGGGEPARVRHRDPSLRACDGGLRRRRRQPERRHGRLFRCRRRRAHRCTA